MRDIEKFLLPDYLQNGNPRQQKAYTALMKLNIFAELVCYSPVLTGTIPIELDLPDSDLDIVCCVEDHEQFERDCRHLFGDYPDFALRHKTLNLMPVTICSFLFEGFIVELFGQNRPITAQNAFRHMIVEHRFLRIGGAGVRDGLMQLRCAGYKTEPAFAHYFALPGDPVSGIVGFI